MEINKKTSNATYKSVNGVTYYKLRSKLEGDYTKNCGLLGEEIDENFYFLRGYDIKDVYINEAGQLVIERVNSEYEPLLIGLDKSIEKLRFELDKERGTIIITYPDGTVDELEGFYVSGRDFTVPINDSLNGNGSIYNPLRLSEVYRTGTYGSVSEFFDLTKDPTMPEVLGKGYRIITKECVDSFGRLYPYSAVEKIQKKLKEMGSPWRVPSKADWDELLNAMETNSADRNHDSKEAKWLGNVAGAALKSVNFWEDYNTLPTEMSVHGEDIVGLSILPLGIGPDRNEIIDDVNADIEGFHKLGGMWTSTTNETGNAYVKIFGYNSAKVDQDTYGEGARMSIRLVKDYANNNYNEVETILGLIYPTELVNGICDDKPYSKIWTKINVYNTDPALNGIRSTEWDEINGQDKGVKFIFFVNEWDGKEWLKKAIDEGDSVVIANHNNKQFHEWRLINGELVDTLDAVVGEFDSIFNDFNERIEKNLISINDEEIARNNADEILQNNINAEIANRENADKILQENINNEATTRENNDRKLQLNIDNEAKAREAKDIELQKNIDNEAEIRAAKDIELQTNIDNEANTREKNDLTLKNFITEEANYRLSGDTVLNAKIEAEINTRIEVDEAINEAIKNESERITNLSAKVDENKVKIYQVTPSSENVLEEYVLKNDNGVIFGDTIKIYKDNSLLGIKIGHEGATSVIQEADGTFTLLYSEGANPSIEYIYLIYRDINGNTQLAGINFEQFLLESEFGEGLKINDHVVSVKIKENEKFLKVDNNGLFIEGFEVSIKEVETSNPNIKSRFELQDINGNQLGDAIELIRESSLVDFKQGRLGAYINEETGAYIEGTGDITMDFIYRLEDGRYKLVQIPVSEYFTDAHFGKGLNNQDGVISLKEGGANEYLVINENTIEVVGVNTAILNSKNEAISGATAISNSYTDKRIFEKETDINNTIGVLSTSLTEQINIVNENLSKEVSNRENSIASLNESFGNLVGDVNNKVGVCEAAINAEVSAREAAINAEVSAREAAINAEVSAREAANLTLSANLVTLINAEANIRNEKDLNIETSIDNVNKRIDIIIGVDENKTIRNIAAEEAALKVAEVVADADTSFDTLKEIADWIQNDTTGAAKIANDVKQAVETVESISGTVHSVVYGDGNDSINHRISDEFKNSLIINGIPVTNVPLDEANTHSLIRIISTENGEKYFVSNLAEDMWYKSKDGQKEILNEVISNIKTTINDEIKNRENADLELNTKIDNEISARTEAVNSIQEEISNLKSENEQLKAKIAELENDVKDIKENINNYINTMIISKLVGVKNEIKIVENSDGKIQIGFADDAIFG